jgi:hypothetical protein
VPTTPAVTSAKKPAKVKAEKAMKMESAETVRLVLTDENGQQHFASGDNQTIILGADGTIMNHNNQVIGKWLKYISHK